MTRAMDDSHMSIFCVVDGESTPFPVEIEPTKTIGALKQVIKDVNAVTLADVDAKMLTLWKVSIPVLPKKDRKDISLADVPSQEELDEIDDVSDVFKETLPKRTIHVIVQRPLPAPARATAPPTSSADSRPGTAPSVPFVTATSRTSQISRQTPKQEGVEVVKFTPSDPKQLQRATPSVLQALPVSNHYGDHAAKSNPAEEADTDTEAESEVPTQGQVLHQDQDQVKPISLSISEHSRGLPAQEEGDKPSSDLEEAGISHGPLTTHCPSDDDEAEHVKDDSLIPDGRQIAQDNNHNSDSVVIEEEASDATPIGPTARCTQAKEPIKKDSLVGVNARKEEDEGEESEDEENEDDEDEDEGEEETVYCNVIGITTGRPCRFPASQCPHHRDSQGQVLVFCNVIGSTTGRPCRYLASKCPHHRDSRGKVLNFCNVIGYTTGRPCRFPASRCPHH